MRQSSNYLTLAFFVALGWVLHRTRGHYDQDMLFVVVAAWLACAIAYLRETKSQWSASETRLPDLSPVLAAVLLFFLYKLLRNPMIGFAEIKFHSRVVKGTLWIALGLAIPLSIGVWRSRPFRAKSTAFYLAVAIGASLVGARVFALLASPSPRIDVFTIGMDGAQHFLNGINPYSQDYADLYDGKFDYKPGYTYWPAVLYIETLFKAVFGDIRAALIAAEVLIAAGIGRIARRLGWGQLEASLLGVVWLAFPASLFVLEQAWVDTFLLLFAVGFAHFGVSKQWLRAGIMLGLFCSVKQYAIFFALLAGALSLRDARPARAATRLTGAALATFALVTVPFMLWDWPSFYENTIHMPLAISMRDDALTLIAFAKSALGVEIRGSVTGIAYLAFTAALIATVLRAPRERAIVAFAGAVPLLYGWVFLLGKQAFCNYYHLLAGFLLLQLCFWKSDQSYPNSVNDRLTRQSPA